MKYQKSINTIGWLVGAVSLLVYALTLSPTLSFWDSGEFIATGSKLQVGHPPGAPLYQLLAAFVSIFTFGNQTLIAPFVNALSALAASLTIVFFFWILVRFLNRFSDKYVGNIVAAAIGALTFAFTDSFWASATEAEVYSLSLLFSTLIIWAVMKWDERPDARWFVFIAFLIGLSLGIHLLSLLVLPAVSLIVCFHYFKPSFVSVTLTLIIAVLTIWGLYSLFPLLLSADYLPLYIILGVLIVLLVFSILKKIALLSAISLSFLFFILGISTYIILIVRAEAGVPINEYVPQSSQKLIYYLERENYEKPPLFFGNQYTAYSFAKYNISETGDLEVIYNRNTQSFFPRMWNPVYETAYTDWTGTPEKAITANGQTFYTPSFAQNFNFFLQYQLGYMYNRYLMWNFVGRTNDIQGFGDAGSGQWKSGIKYLDNLFGINTQAFPENTLRKGGTAYFFIPLLLAIVGLIYQYFKDRKGFWVNTMLFVFTSVCVVVYLNLTPYQARERDYIFITSFLSVSVWLCIGVLGISQIIVNILFLHLPRYVAVFFFIVPLWLLSQNFASHNHSHQYTAKNFAQSLLESCEKNAVLFTSADNDTFPLWYLQNVEGIRTDIRVINLAFLNDADYIDNLQKRVYESAPLHLITQPSDYKNANLNYNSSARNLVSDKPTSIMKHLNREIILQDNVYALQTLILMDLIVANIEQRPVYFSAYSYEDLLNLNNYLTLEGFAYRLNTIQKNGKQDMLPPKYGSVNANKMYENFKQFQWRGFKRPRTTFNELERSIVDFYAQNASFLAFGLYQAKEYQKADEVITKCTENIPFTVHKYPHSLAHLAVIECLLDGKLAEDKDIYAISHHYLFYVIDYYKGYMRYYLNLKDSFKAHERWEAEKIMTNWLYLCLFIDDNKLDDLREDLTADFFNYASEYLKICYDYLETIKDNSDFYKEEIEKTTALVKGILDLGKAYEEKLPQPPASLKL
ncbi:MAG: DUF2723 domain-containing protein [Bacteroidales bacterium]|jgi:hypothetical protein|nr:DUF2723 domain-containing protein [Bacteroidales bacterium]